MTTKRVVNPSSPHHLFFSFFLKAATTCSKRVEQGLATHILQNRCQSSLLAARVPAKKMFQSSFHLNVLDSTFIQCTKQEYTYQSFEVKRKFSTKEKLENCSYGAHHLFFFIIISSYLSPRFFQISHTRKEKSSITTTKVMLAI